MRLAHPPLEHGRIRPSAGQRSGTGGRHRSVVHVQHRYASRDDAAPTYAKTASGQRRPRRRLEPGRQNGFQTTTPSKPKRRWLGDRREPPAGFSLRPPSHRRLLGEDYGRETYSPSWICVLDPPNSIVLIWSTPFTLSVSTAVFSNF